MTGVNALPTSPYTSWYLLFLTLAQACKTSLEWRTILFHPPGSRHAHTLVSRLDTYVRGGVVIDTNSRPWNHGFNSREIKPSDPDYITMLISWTVTPSLVETFHAAFYSLHPHQSYWVASLARRPTGLVRRLAALAHRST